MKKVLLSLLILVSSLFLVVSCSKGEADKPVTPPVVDPTPKPDPEPEVKPDPEIKPQEDYTINTSCTAGSIEKDTYKFSVLSNEDKDNYFGFDDIIINIVINQHDWKYVTSANKEKSKILSQDENVLPVDAVSYKFMQGDKNVETQVTHIELKIDRSKVSVGNSKVKVLIVPSNGVNTATDLELCFNVEVIPHGSIDPKMNNVTFNLDFSNLPSEYINQELELAWRDEDHIYEYSYKAYNKVFVTSKDKNVEFKMPVGNRLDLVLSLKDDFKVKFKLELDSDDSYEVKENFIIFKSAPTKELTLKVVGLL